MGAFAEGTLETGGGADGRVDRLPAPARVLWVVLPHSGLAGLAFCDVVLMILKMRSRTDRVPYWSSLNMAVNVLYIVQIVKGSGREAVDWGERPFTADFRTCASGPDLVTGDGQRAWRVQARTFRGRRQRLRGSRSAVWRSASRTAIATRYGGRGGGWGDEVPGSQFGSEVPLIHALGYPPRRQPLLVLLMAVRIGHSGVVSGGP